VVTVKMQMPLTIKVKLAKMGNSLRMTVPKPVYEALDWKDGDTLEVGITDNSMIVRKVIGERAQARRQARSPSD